MLHLLRLLSTRLGWILLPSYRLRKPQTLPILWNAANSRSSLIFSDLLTSFFCFAHEWPESRNGPPQKVTRACTTKFHKLFKNFPRKANKTKPKKEGTGNWTRIKKACEAHQPDMVPWAKMATVLYLFEAARCSLIREFRQKSKKFKLMESNHQ